MRVLKHNSSLVRIKFCLSVSVHQNLTRHLERAVKFLWSQQYYECRIVVCRHSCQPMIGMEKFPKHSKDTSTVELDSKISMNMHMSIHCHANTWGYMHAISVPWFTVCIGLFLTCNLIYVCMLLGAIAATVFIAFLLALYAVLWKCMVSPPQR